MIIFEETDTFWSPRLTQFDPIITSVADPADLTGKIFTFQNRHNLVNGQLSTSPSRDGIGGYGIRFVMIWIFT